ncbi:hypothetical protein [Deinococcus maricopensis]|uniref:hypothetical protein n=1 Tax=Deinococcus maricopensis TaxID=309887 RepID=UPI0011D2C272|nr:hypothetical protein [Deinococcus maricopensis]
MLAVLLPSAVAAPVTPREALLPTPAALGAACLAGVDAAAAPARAGEVEKYIFTLSDDDLQLLGGEALAFSRCRADGRAPDAPWSAEALGLRLVARGAVLDLADAAAWTAALVIDDAAGRELARLQPTSVDAGGVDSWTQDCDTGACGWEGANTYTFGLEGLTAEQRAAVQADARVRVEVTRRYGLETFTLSGEQRGD